MLEHLVRRAAGDALLEMLDRCLEGDFQIERRAQLVLVLEAIVDSLGQEINKGR